MICRKTAVLLLAAVLVLPLMIPATAGAVSAKALKVFPGSLDPGGSTSFSWNLNQDISEFLFHYQVTGGTDPLDVAYVSIDETGDHWDFLMGDGWTYCDCRLDAGVYTVTVEADAGATVAISFNVGFYLVSQAPVDFAGFIPASSGSRVSDFAAFFPSSASYTLALGVTAGSFEFFVDGETQGVVTERREIALDFAAGSFHLFEVSSSAVSPDEDVRWTIEVQGQPRLEVSVLSSCPVLNPEADQSVCVLGVNVTASDGGTPTVAYLWTASGGELNSTTSRWVRFNVVPGVANYTLTVQASAPGYISGNDSLKVQVVPEFPATAPLIIALALFVTALLVGWQNAKRRRAKAGGARLVSWQAHNAIHEYAHRVSHS
jgi:hypothetical protein